MVAVFLPPLPRVERIDEKCNAVDGIVNDANDAGSRRPPLEQFGTASVPFQSLATFSGNPPPPPPRPARTRSRSSHGYPRPPPRVTVGAHPSAYFR